MLVRPLKRRILNSLSSLLLCALVAAPMALTAAPRPPSKKTYKQQIAQMETQWIQAQRTGDAAAIEKLLSDDYIGINSQGMVSTKAQAVERVRARQTAIDKLDVLEQKITVHGDTAIVTSQVVVELTNNTVKPPVQTHSRLRYTRVYLRYASGTWRIVNFEATHINDMPGTGPLSAEPGVVQKPTTKAKP